RSATSCCSTRMPGRSGTPSRSSPRLPTSTPRRRSSGRGCSTRTGLCSDRRARFRRCGGWRPTNLSRTSSAPRPRFLNSFYEGDFDHDAAREVDWLFGASLLVRRDAADEVGLFDEDFFMFSEETDWCFRFRQARWSVWFFPGADVVHVGGASHGGRLFEENVR